jgi:hypothetical protein
MNVIGGPSAERHHFPMSTSRLTNVFKLLSYYIVGDPGHLLARFCHNTLHVLHPVKAAAAWQRAVIKLAPGQN